MNILESETRFLIEANTCGYSKRKSISYHLGESSYSLCLDKSEIILAQIHACNRLLMYARDKSDIEAINRELAELKLTLDTMHY